jgi:hypothetical protein
MALQSISGSVTSATGVSGAVLKLSTVGGTKYSNTDAWGVQNVLTDGTQNIVVGGNSADRVIGVIGSCTNGSTAGFLRPQFAQLTADASDTIVRAALSNIQVWQAQNP